MRQRGAVYPARRRFLATVAGFSSFAFLPQRAMSEEDPIDPVELIRKLTGRTAAESDRVHLDMPAVFPNGYTVPLTLKIDCPMTESDNVTLVRVLAPRNPIIEVATFHFVALRSEPHVSTRIRLAAPQHVLALAQMSDGSFLLAKTWVQVTSNGCK